MKIPMFFFNQLFESIICSVLQGGLPLVEHSLAAPRSKTPSRVHMNIETQPHVCDGATLARTLAKTLLNPSPDHHNSQKQECEDLKESV